MLRIVFCSFRAHSSRSFSLLFSPFLFLAVFFFVVVYRDINIYLWSCDFLSVCAFHFPSVCRFMKETYTPFLLSTKGKALVLLGSVALFAAGVYGVVEVRSLHNLGRDV